MIKIELNVREAVMLAGILGVTEGTSLNDVYYQLLKAIRSCDKEKYVLIEDITNLMQEEIHIQDDPSINEDYLYFEARKLNGLLD